VACLPLAQAGIVPSAAIVAGYIQHCVAGSRHLGAVLVSDLSESSPLLVPNLAGCYVLFSGEPRRTKAPLGRKKAYVIHDPEKRSEPHCHACYELEKR